MIATGGRFVAVVVSVDHETGRVDVRGRTGHEYAIDTKYSPRLHQVVEIGQRITVIRAENSPFLYVAGTIPERAPKLSTFGR